MFPSPPRIIGHLAPALTCLALACSAAAQQGGDRFFERIAQQKIESSPAVEWKNFGPGMAGYCEEFWTHPTDPDAMFMGPDMYVTYGTWDGGASWQTVKDPDGLGLEMKRVLDIEFSLQNADFGMAIDWNGWAYQTTDRGRSWTKTTELGAALVKTGADEKQRPGGMFQSFWQSRMGELAVDPTDDTVWFVGAGDFWNAKDNHKSAKQPHGDRLPFAAYGFVLKSTDQGRTWTKITKGLPDDVEVAKIVVDPTNNQRVVMATSHGVMASDDGGLSWAKSADGLPNDLPRDLTSFYDAKTGTFVLYLVEQTVYQPDQKTVRSSGGVYRSTDGGKQWTSITGDLGLDLTAINFSTTTDQFHDTVSHWLGIGKKEAKSRFSEAPKDILPVFSRIAVNPLNKDEIYLALNKKHDHSFGPGELWQTLDGGKHWFASARYGSYWKSGKDKGYWSKRRNPTGTNMRFAHLQDYMDQSPERSGNRMLAVTAAGDVLIGVDQQTLRSTDRGKSWQQIDDDETAPGSHAWIGRGGSDLPGRVMLLETGIKGRRLLCSGEHGLWQTTGLGRWPDQNAVAVEQIEGQVHEDGAESIATVAVHPKDPKTIFILSWRQTHRGKLRRTTDGGKTWENIATLFDTDNNSWEDTATQNALTIDPANPDNMYFCATFVRNGEISGGTGPKLTKGEYGFYRSSDGGLTWEPSNRGFHKGASVRRITLHPDHPEVILAAANDKDGGLYRSTDRGGRWERVALPESIGPVNHVFVDRNNRRIYLSVEGKNRKSDGGGVWVSTDDGARWHQIFRSHEAWQAETSPVNPDLIVVSVPGRGGSRSTDFMNPGIYLSQDAGKRWLKINRGLGQPDRIVDVKPDPEDENVLWCAGWGSGWFKAVIAPE